MVGVVLGAGACRTWQPAPLPHVGGPARQTARHARLVHPNGRIEELKNVVIERDTVRAELRRPVAGRGSVVVPLDSVRTLEVRAVSPGRTLAFAAAYGVLALFSVLMGG
jgi:hypothetical protein